METEQLPWLQDIGPAEHHTDRLLQTELAKEELQKRQYYIHQQAQSVFEEQGHSILYLALGYLEWNESKNAEQFNLAPLILIPVELERQKYVPDLISAGVVPNYFQIFPLRQNSLSKA